MSTIKLIKTQTKTQKLFNEFLDGKTLPPICCERIMAELVNNTLKHAEWSRIDAMLQVLPKSIRIVYTDNGQGFEPAYEQKNGIGLANIRERVDKLRGQLSLRNNYPEGYTIEINIPFA